MRVLLIAPDLGLENVKHEIRTISFALQATILSGEVLHSDVVSSMKDKSWDVVWIAAHGKSNGIELSNGLLSTSDLTGVVRNTNAKLLFLNTCDSKIIGLELNYELGIDVICIEGEVGDAGAFQMGCFFANNVSSGMSVKDAFEKSKPGQNGKYYFLSGKNGLGSLSYTHSAIESNAQSVKDINRTFGEWEKNLESRISKLEVSLHKEILDLRSYLSDMRRSVDAAVKLPPWNKQVFFLASALIMLPIALFFVEIRNAVAIGWQTSYFVSLLMYVGSAILWAYLWWGYRGK